MKINSKGFPSQLPEMENSSEQQKIQKLADHFESVFINQMIAEMRKTVGRGGLIPEGQAEKIYRGMLDQKIAETMSESHQLGLSQLIVDSFRRK